MMKIFLAFLLAISSNVCFAQDKTKFTVAEKQLIQEVALKMILVRFANPPLITTELKTGSYGIEALSEEVIVKSFNDAKTYVEQVKKLYQTE